MLSIAKAFRSIVSARSLANHPTFNGMLNPFNNLLRPFSTTPASTENTIEPSIAASAQQQQLLQPIIRPLFNRTSSSASPSTSSSSLQSNANAASLLSSLGKDTKVLIQFLQNNVFINIQRPDGTSMKSLSAGSVGFKNTAKLSQKAVFCLVDALRLFLQQRLNSTRIRLELRGFNSVRTVLIHQLRRSGIDIGEVMDTTGVPHGGCRPPKARRL